jgi:plastocyanin
LRKTLPALVGALVLLGGCSSGGHKKQSGGSTVTVGHNQPIAFGAFEYRFEPKNVVVNSGSTKPTLVRFVMRNNGSQGHDLHIEKDGRDLGGTPVLGPAQTKSGQATLSPGTYQFICTVGNHADLGMKGTLTVTSKKTARPKDPDAGEKPKPGEKK